MCVEVALGRQPPSPSKPCVGSPLGYSESEEVESHVLQTEVLAFMEIWSGCEPVCLMAPWLLLLHSLDDLGKNL